MMRRWGFQSTHLLSASLCTGLALAGVCLPRPAAAQTIYLDEGGPGRFGPGRFGPEGFDAVMPSDVMSSVRSTGLRPVSRPVLRGRRYVLHAIDTDGVPVRVVVNARTGEVMNVRAVGPNGGQPQSAGRRMGPGGQRADRSYIDPETGERIYEEHVYREGEGDQAAPGSRGQHGVSGAPDHPNAAAKPPTSKKAEKVKLPPRKTAARTPEKDIKKDVQKNVPDSAKATAPQQPADTAHESTTPQGPRDTAGAKPADKPVKDETATKTPEPKNADTTKAETKDSVDHQPPSSTETVKNVDQNATGDNAVEAKAPDSLPVSGQTASGKSAPKIDRALAERVNAQVVARAKAEAKAQAAAKSEPKAAPENNAANSKHKTDHETDGSASEGKGFPPVQDLE